MCLFSSYCLLQCLKQADIEQVCWETVGNINENEKAEQNVMETFGGVVVEARKLFCYFETVTGLWQKQQNLP